MLLRFLMTRLFSPRSYVGRHRYVRQGQQIPSEPEQAFAEMGAVDDEQR